jgi:hypothetical protein
MKLSDFGPVARCLGPWPACGHERHKCTAHPDYQAAIKALEVPEKDEAPGPQPPPPASPPEATGDPELEAIAAGVRSLSALSEDGRLRVLAYLTERFGCDVEPPPDDDGGLPAVASERALLRAVG